MYLGIDLGTGTLKVALFDDDGTLLEIAEEAYSAPAEDEGIAEFDPFVWWDVCRRVVRGVTGSHGSEVRSIGLAGQMHGVVLIGEDGKPVRPAVLWPDHRATEELVQFMEFDEQNPGVIGNPLVPGMAGPILAWLARYEPETLRRTAAVVQPKDWLRTQLCRTGPASDPSDASATLLYDIAADTWSDGLCRLAGIEPSLLPPLHDSDAAYAEIDLAVARELNLGAVPVVTGSGDSAAALLGAGLERQGTALINIGTGGQIMTPVDAASTDSRLGPGIHQYRSASHEARWYAMAAIANAGLALNWVRSIVGYDWDRLYATAGQVLDVDTDPVFLPFLATERMPSHDTPRGGAWVGLTLADDPDTLVRGAVWGVAAYLGLRAKALMQLTSVSAAVMSGGSTRHDAWVELLATVLGSEVEVSADPHLTVRGAARLAARGVGADLPIPPPGRVVRPRPGVDLGQRVESFRREMDHHFSTSG